MPDIDAAAILTELGEDYSESKALEGVTTDTMLAKIFIDTKAKLGEKLDNVIQKPKADATDAQKAEYKGLLKKELGAPETIEAYESTPVDGVTVPPELATLLKQAFLDEGIPIDAYARIREKLDKYRATANTEAKTAEDRKYNDEVEKFKAAHPGDKLVIGVRTALKALIHFDFPAQKELTDAIKTAKLLDNPNDFAALKKLGINMASLSRMELIGNAMKSDTTITNEGTPASMEASKPDAGTPEALIHNAYNHPTSVKDRQKRGVKY